MKILSYAYWLQYFGNCKQLALFVGVLCETSKPVAFPLLFWRPLLSYSSKSLPLFNFLASHIYVCDLIVAHVATFFFFKTELTFNFAAR